MKYIQFFSKVVFLSLAGIFFSSCMHTMMMGGHDSHGDYEATTATKEVISGAFNLSVSIPQMEVGKEGVITISLKSKTAIPDSVEFHYMISQSSKETTSSRHEHGQQNNTKDFKMIHQQVSLIRESVSIPYTPPFAGQFVFSTETTIDSSSLSAEMTFIVYNKKESGMMGMGSIWDFPILGVLAMGAMMMTVWAVRGSL
ncbi:MAG: hypothetical protein M0R68_08500 [Bacteroidetes bacterium]|nr:hypothetical protein [Bacteroidota bacterium]